MYVCVDEPRFHCISSDVDGYIVGGPDSGAKDYIKLSTCAPLSDNAEVIIQWFQIRTKYRKQGYGRKIFLALLNRYRNCKRFVVQQVSAVGFWTALGFVSDSAGGMTYDVAGKSYPKQTSTNCDPVDPHALGRSLVKRTCPRTSTNPKTIRATLRRQEKRLVDHAASCDHTQPGSDKWLVAALRTPIGKKRFTHLTKSLEVSEGTRTIAANAIKTIATVERRHKHEVVSLLTTGLPKSFVLHECGITRSSYKYYKDQRKRSGHLEQSILFSKYPVTQPICFLCCTS